LEDIDEKKAWNKIEDRIAGEVENSASTSWSILPKTTFLKIAAIILLLLVAFNGFLLVLTNQDDDVEYITKKTRDQIATFFLSDSSKVVLNAYSTLTFPEAFTSDNDREVFLEGEAFFELSSHDSQPFFVSTNWGTVEGKSNVFDVSAYRHMQYVEVIVESGKVCFHKPEKKNPDPRVYLEQGESIVYTSKGKQTLERCCKQNNHLAWKKGFLHYSDTDIETVFKELESLYHVSFHYAEKAKTLSGKYHYSSLDSVLQNLKDDLKFTYQKNGTQIAIHWQD